MSFVNYVQQQRKPFKKQGGLTPEVQTLLNIAELKGLKGAEDILKEKRPKTSTLMKALRILQTGEFAVGGLLSGKGIRAGIKQQITPSRALGISRKHKDFKSAIKDPSSYLAFAVDVLLDPVTYVSFGLGEGAQIAGKTGSVVLNKTGKELLRETTERLAKTTTHEIAEAQARKIMARRIATKNGAEKYIDKGGLKFFGQTILPQTTLKKPIQMVGKGLEKIPGVSETVESFNKAFKPFNEIKTKIPLGDKYIQSFSNLQKAIRAQNVKFLERIGLMKKQAKQLQKLVGNKPIEDIIAESMQTGKFTGIREVDGVIKGLNEFNKKFRLAEKSRGIKVGNVPNYLRRFLTEDGRKYIEKGGQLNISISRPPRVKAGFAKGRRFVKILDEEGNEIIASKKLLNITEINKNKLISKIEKDTANQIGIIQDTLKRLAKPERTKELAKTRELIKSIKKQLIPDVAEYSDDIIDPTKVDKKLFKNALESIIGPERRELETALKEAEQLLKADIGREFLNKPLKLRNKIIDARKKKIVELSNKIVKIQNDAFHKIEELEFFDFINPVTGKRYKLSDTPLTIAEINKEMEPILYQVLGKKGLKFFEEDPFKAVAGRGVESFKAQNTIDWFNDVARQFGKVGGELDEAGKLRPQIINGVQYVESSVKELKGVLLPKPIVKHLDDMYTFLNNDEATNAFLKTYDKILAIWKGSVTGWFPAFHTRNFIGGVWNNFLAGLKDPKMYAIGNDIARGKQGYIVTQLGRKIDYADIRKLINQKGITGQPGILDVFQETEKLAEAGWKRKITELPKVAMGTVEDRLRIPLFVDRLIKGDTVDQAAKKVFQFHFDYAPEGLTLFERNVMRRLLPFYRWSRGNIPLQLENLAKQPGKYAGLQKLIDTVQDTDKARMEYKDLPEYMRENIPIRIGEKQGMGQYLYGLGLPVEDINKLWRGSIKRTMQGILGEFSPALKFPLEKATGINLYFGTPIKDWSRAPSFLKKLPKPVKDWLDMKEITKSDGTKKLVADPDKLHTLQAILSRGWITADKLSNDKTLTAIKVLYSLTGLKAKSVNLEQQRYFYNRDRIRALEDYFQRMGEGRIFQNFYFTKEQKEQFPKEIQEALKLQAKERRKKK